MELELGLGISGNGFGVGFDLNCNESDDNEVLDVGSCLWSDQSSNGEQGECNSEKKRGFCEAYDRDGKFVVGRKTLPLLAWDSKQPNEEEEDHQNDQNSSTTNNNYEEEDGVVGWPPIKSWRKKLRRKNNVYGDGGCDGGGGSNSTFVKVKMEGVVITRKVDLSLYHSYQELKDTLVEMFGRGEENVDAYNLTYQDREGDWLLAADVPWRKSTREVKAMVCPGKKMICTQTNDTKSATNGMWRDVNGPHSRAPSISSQSQPVTTLVVADSM